MKKTSFIVLLVLIIQGCSQEIDVDLLNHTDSIKEDSFLPQSTQLTSCSTIRKYQTTFSQSEVEHLQGIAYNEDYMFLSYTYKIVKKDCNDNIVGFLDGNNHFGDPVLFNGYLYVPNEKGDFNSKGNNDSYVYKIDPNNMTVVETYPISETLYGIGGMSYGNNKFILVGGNDDSNTSTSSVSNFLFEYDINFNHTDTYCYYTGNTNAGIQTVEYNSIMDEWVIVGYSGYSPYSNFVIDNNDMLLKKTLEPDPDAGWNVNNLSNIGFSPITSNKYFNASEVIAQSFVDTSIDPNQPYINNPLTNFVYQLSELNNWMINLNPSEVSNLNNDLSNKYSINVDFKLPSGSVGSNRWAYFIAGGYDNTQSYNNYNGALVFYPQSNNGNGAFKFFVKDSQNNQAVIETPSNMVFEEDVHYNLTGTYDGLITRLYLDGKLIGTSSVASGNIKDFSNFTIGAIPSGAHQFEGDIWNLNISKDLL